MTFRFRLSTSSWAKSSVRCLKGNVRKSVAETDFLVSGFAEGGLVDFVDPFTTLCFLAITVFALGFVSRSLDAKRYEFFDKRSILSELLVVRINPVLSATLPSFFVLHVKPYALHLRPEILGFRRFAHPDCDLRIGLSGLERYEDSSVLVDLDEPEVVLQLKL